ncbi:cholinesterase 1-like [Oppia nitens]|uniref:cholinesterase 1-like n=1 Tax=Oppia nitens TaxID=1686743 RepID=UPI0023DC041E|nr:cholinesterase 1-like [Oppia nitens]
MNTRVMTDYEFRQWIALKAIIGNTATMCPTIGGIIIKCIVCTTIEPLVTTSSGTVRGQTLHLLNKKIDQYLNIPFAEPPVGRLRFAKPVPLITSKNDIIDGTKPGNSCIQTQAESISNLFSGLQESEDCLVLNVWSPQTTGAINVGGGDSDVDQPLLKPVMFWIYGGALSKGSIFQDIYNASALAATGDVVIVAANYRVGALGFLYGADDSAPGNVGFYDQLVALQWVRDNIHAFGGDRDQITIFGVSAGSWSVSAHLLSPLSIGLYRRAIMQSGAVMFNKDRPILDTVDALSKAKQLANRVGCDPYDYYWLDCLRAINDPKLLKDINPYGGTYVVTYPVIGTEFLPVLTQKAFELNNYNKDIDLLIGATSNEGNGLLLLVYPETTGANITIELFYKILDYIDQDIHNVDKLKIADYYLDNVDTTNSSQLLRAMGDLFGHLLLLCPTYKFAKQFAGRTASGTTRGVGGEHQVYYYEWAYKSRNNIMRALEQQLGLPADLIHHGADIDFIFGKPFITDDNDYSKLDYDFSLETMKMWTNFAKYGKPNNEWPEFLDNNNKINNNNQLKTIKVKYLSPNIKQINSILDDPYVRTCDGIWSDYF